jgi:hypothetical protein
MGLDAEDNWVIHLRLENRASEIMNFRFFYQSINGLAIDDELNYRALSFLHHMRLTETPV